MSSKTISEINKSTNRPLAWTLIILLGIGISIWMATHPHRTPTPSWGELPPPSALAIAFNLKPVALGTSVPLKYIPTPVWSGADEELQGSVGILVAYDGAGKYILGSHITTTPTPTPGVFLLHVNNETAIQVVWKKDNGWVATAIWNPPPSLVPVLAKRLLALSNANGAAIQLPNATP